MIRQIVRSLLLTLIIVAALSGCRRGTTETGIPGVYDKKIAVEIDALLLAAYEESKKLRNPGGSGDLVKAITGESESGSEQAYKMLERRRALWKANGQILARVNETLRRAAELYYLTVKKISPFDAKKVIMNEFHERHTPPTRIHLFPERTLIVPPDIPACPTVGKRYKHLVFYDGEYWEDISYRGVARRDEVPDEALMALVTLMLVPTRGIENDIAGISSARQLLLQSGERGVACILAFLADPEKHGLQPSPPLPDQSLDSYQDLSRQYYDLVMELPPSVSEKFYRILLSSGWNESVRYFRSPRYAAVADGFHDSPYGDPGLMALR